MGVTQPKPQPKRGRAPSSTGCTRCAGLLQPRAIARPRLKTAQCAAHRWPRAGDSMKKFLIALAAGQCMAMAAAQTPAAPEAASFRCGGIGVEDQQAMKAQAGKHDAMLT